MTTAHICRQISKSRKKSALLIILYLITSAIYYIPINVAFISDAFRPEFQNEFYCGHLESGYKRAFQWISDFLLPLINPIVFYALSSSLRQSAAILFKNSKIRAIAIFWRIFKYFTDYHTNELSVVNRL